MKAIYSPGSGPWWKSPLGVGLTGRGESISPPLSRTHNETHISTPPHPRFALLPRPSGALRGGGSHGISGDEPCTGVPHECDY